MPDPIVPPAATPPPAAADPNLLKEAGKETPPAAAPGAAPNVLDDAAKQAQEAKAAEDKRILEADPATLNDAEKATRADLEKAREEKRLRETPKEQLSKEDQDKQAVLLKAKADADAKASGVPEKYEIKVPDGMTLNQGFLDKVTPVLKELKASQAMAQRLADVYIEQRKAEEDAKAAGFKQFLQDSYDETVKALSEGGKDYKKELASVVKIRDRILSKETIELLDASGMSNNKAFILDLIKFGKMISEDQLKDGPPDAPGGKSVADRIYEPPKA